jgi:glutamine synthetase
LEIGADQLAHLLKDNTDRNRTSPFAFTGNKFEFRAVGSSQSVGFPLTILNGAMAEVLNDAAGLVEGFRKAGKTIDESLLLLIRDFMGKSKKVIFSGDGYSQEWVNEAKKRGLSNYKNTPEALMVLKDTKQMAFLRELGIFRGIELETRYNVALENYCMHREIEFFTLLSIVNQSILPAGFEYKKLLLETIKMEEATGLKPSAEKEVLWQLNDVINSLYGSSRKLDKALKSLDQDDQKKANAYATEVLELAEEIAQHCNILEEIVPDHKWPLPKYYDLLFLR